MQLLAEQPLMGAPREGLAPGLRVLPQARYLIFRRTREPVVEIVRIIHASRDVTAIDYGDRDEPSK